MKAARLSILSISQRDCLMVGLGALVVIAGIVLSTYMSNRHVPLAGASTRITTPWIPASVKQWEQPISAVAAKYNIDPNLLAIIMTLESGGNPTAVSEADARGLMQVTLPTASDIASKFLKEPRSSYDLFDPKTNIEFGAAYLAYLRDEFGTARQGPDWTATVELIAAGYNGGPGAANNLEQGKGLDDTETVVYARDAFNMWRERHNKTSPTYNRWLERGGSTLVNTVKTEQ